MCADGRERRPDGGQPAVVRVAQRVRLRGRPLQPQPVRVELMLERGLGQADEGDPENRQRHIATLLREMEPMRSLRMRR